MLEYEIKDGFNDVEYCFLITANPIDTESNAMSEEELNRLIMEGGDISEIANKSNISPFRTILFPNTSQICDVFLSLLDKNEEREKKGEKPIFLLSTSTGLSKKHPSRILDVIQKTETELKKATG